MTDRGVDGECPAEQVVSDERTIYGELIAPMESRMMRSVWRVVRRAELAEDALQDALLVICKKLHHISRHPNPQALILKICVNAAYDSLRRQKRFLKHEDVSRFYDLPDSDGANAVSILESKEIESNVLSAISRLPRRQGIAVLMRIVHDEPFDVIAQALDCSEVTVRIHVFKGRKRLRQLLSSSCCVPLQEVSK